MSYELEEAVTLATSLQAMLQQMLRIRIIEERIAELYPEQEMRCPVHLCIGQEAVAVGVCAHLGIHDQVFSGHRSHGHYLAKGGGLKLMMAELYARQSGCSGGKGGSMHLIDLAAGFLGATPIVGSTIPIAVGAALGAVMQDQDRISVVFFGDGAVETGVFHESIGFAALKRLPVVFVCENNLYSVYSPMSVRQSPDRTLSDVAHGHGVPTLRGDGNDVEAVAALALPAIERARSGGGPTFLEFSTYRWREHCGPYYDNKLGYRTEAEFEAWKEQCPIERLSARLIAEGELSPLSLERMKQALLAEMDAAVAYARSSPVPLVETLMEGVHAS